MHMTVVDRLLYLGGCAAELGGQGADAALGMHEDVVRVYEQACNAYTFDFERDVGRYMAADVTVVSGGMQGGRSLLCETLDARAEYVRNTEATVTANLDITCAAELETTAVLVAEGDLTFTYPDGTTYTQHLLISSTLRLLDGLWIFQHVHFGKDCCW